jgi:predicted nucleic acid-binding Zn ribbon protein
MSKWNIPTRKCAVCSKPFESCAHTESDEMKHKSNMKIQAKQNKKIQQLVQIMVDKALKERGL